MRAGAVEEERYYELQGRVWRRLAPLYDVVVRPLRRLRRTVAERLGATRGVRILDVATGTGEQALAFAERGASVVGIDLSPAMLDIARRKARGTSASFRTADAVALPFADASFDAGGISFALHEMPERVRERALRELARVVRPGGRVAVVDYGLPRSRLGRFLGPRIVALWERDTYREFVRADLAELLARAGLTIERDEPALSGLARVVIALARRERP